MNKERRDIVRLARVHLREAQSLLDEARMMEWDAFDELPEADQKGDRGDKMQATIYDLDKAGDDLEEILDNLAEVMRT